MRKIDEVSPWFEKYVEVVTSGANGEDELLLGWVISYWNPRLGVTTGVIGPTFGSVSETVYHEIWLHEDEELH